MRRRVWIAIALLAFGYALLPPVPAEAGYGAIAWDPASGKAGWIWNQPTRKRGRSIGVAGMRRQRLPASH